LAKNAAAEIVNGSIAPAQGALWIWSNVSHRFDREGDLRIFVGLASEWEDHPESRREIEASIVDAARRLTREVAPRRWLRIQARRGESPISDSGTRVEIEPAELPISDALRSSVVEWVGQFDVTFDPSNEGFERMEDAVRFVLLGRELAGRLQAELGPTLRVEYIPEPTKPPGVRLKRT
jgi:hypothetical protein